MTAFMQSGENRSYLILLEKRDVGDLVKSAKCILE
jgi:hypothetical protein